MNPQTITPEARRLEEPQFGRCHGGTRTAEWKIPLPGLRPTLFCPSDEVETCAALAPCA